MKRYFVSIISLVIVLCMIVVPVYAEEANLRIVYMSHSDIAEELDYGEIDEADRFFAVGDGYFVHTRVGSIEVQIYSPEGGWHDVDMNGYYRFAERDLYTYDKKGKCFF